ncbi:hypothetical protein G7L40_19875 [Paenibacillus polymyxa]|uniref:Calcineurin-like phosphoesterase domain-containing protein n=1 Tax=Paenibacillus polymyxa TaxID=1406 RepID=A0A378Y0U3_PAEPO|nr:hypothetical protein [Paenibacillus polymyxa]MBE7896251.1 hypothetical protein [Paenibacillus polymyxa]MCC3256779.1 hypothetical protein [Paenibacillus polymyxa]QPK54733.1 hypothetical protein G7035_19920 [Paenibacillus polymyxa]QPK59824.1 hypothetical protein G7L40_19875 [Paenibacillus polymyxa]UOD84578.1 hypothetical protein CUU60_04915 [Paenibacillus polymyxa ATCC 842]
MTSLQSLDNETYEEYLIRIGSSKEELGLSWSKIATLMNEYLNEDFTESKYRKEFHLLTRGISIGVKKSSTDEYRREIEDKTIELQKQKYQFQDQKREFNNKIKMIAKFEHLKDEISTSIKQLEKVKPLPYSPAKESPSYIRANVLFSDFHYGQESDNSLNKYNPRVFDKRFNHLVSKTIYYCQKHNVDELTIASIGDQIAGFIHLTSRIEQSEDVISQTQYISERLSEAVAEIAKFVPKVRVINLIGNHSRTFQSKNEAILKENFENIIPWYMETRLREFDNIELLKGEDGYFIDESFKKPHIYVHGDLDHVTTSARQLPQFLGVIPQYIFQGHIHHDTVKDFGRTTVVSNGSLCGVDSYAVSKRMYSDAMQKMHIFDVDGRIEYKIDINLQEVK